MRYQQAADISDNHSNWQPYATFQDGIRPQLMTDLNSLFDNLEPVHTDALKIVDRVRRLVEKGILPA